MNKMLARARRLLNKLSKKKQLVLSGSAKHYKAYSGAWYTSNARHEDEPETKTIFPVDGGYLLIDWHCQFLNRDPGTVVGECVFIPADVVIPARRLHHYKLPMMKWFHAGRNIARWRCEGRL